jgi:hypothetical protein
MLDFRRRSKTGLMVDRRRSIRSVALHGASPAIAIRSIVSQAEWEPSYVCDRIDRLNMIMLWKLMVLLSPSHPFIGQRLHHSISTPLASPNSLLRLQKGRGVHVSEKNIRLSNSEGRKLAAAVCNEGSVSFLFVY